MSEGEDQLGTVLKKVFPFRRISPQHPIKYKNTQMFLDYYLPALRIAAEYDGRQHDTFVPFYHKNQAGFESSKKRDSLKDEWALVNNVLLIRFKYNEKVTVKSLNAKIKEANTRRESE